MDQILDSPIDSHRTLNYAGFWIRFGAYIIDAIILWIVQVAIGFLLIADYSIFGGNIAMSLFQIVLGIAYFCGMESSSRQATLGKLAVGIKVGDENGQQITFGNALGRYLGKILSALILCIGFMMAGWDDKKQALHDKLASTYVFYAPEQ